MSSPVEREWSTDLLGDGWASTTFDLGADADGPLVATLVRPLAPPAPPRGTRAARPAVLYVHGFNDYFFQRHVAERWQADGYAFYALDLRRCGRSLRPWQTPHVVDDLSEHLPELTEAARVIRVERGHDRMVVLAHSTGGLVVSLWAHRLRTQAVIDALVLNSPWFDLNARWFHRVVSTRVLGAAPIDPLTVVAEGLSAYSYHLHTDHGGRWTYDLGLKPPQGPVRAGWLRAVRRGQARLARGLQIDVPVLVATARSSGPNTMDNPELDAQDTVLDVGQIAARSHRLGRDVTLLQVPGAVHDLSLSAAVPREVFAATVSAWLSARLDISGPAD